MPRIWSAMENHRCVYRGAEMSTVDLATVGPYSLVVTTREKEMMETLQ